MILRPFTLRLHSQIPQILLLGLLFCVLAKFVPTISADPLAQEAIESAGEDDFVLEHILTHKEVQKVSTLDQKQSLLKRLMMMKMLWLMAPKSRGTHHIKFLKRRSSKLASIRSQSQAQQKSTQDPYETDSNNNLFPAYNDPETVANFAKMTSNAYVARVFAGWRNVTDYDLADGFGWDEAGLRGYIFVNKAKNIVITSFKGTSIFLAGGDTVSRDKDQDNKMFSCCCGRVDISWIPVCGCYSGGYLSRGNTCSEQCLKDALRSDPDSYFLQAQAIVDQLRQIYPTARMWFTGHSLGGAVANLMALANEGTASIAFDAPGEALYARRMGLIPEVESDDSLPPAIWNFGVSTDPIFMGKCNGITSSCYHSGYALETGCHTGHDCIWEREGREDVGTHRIDWIIDNVIMADPPLPHPQCKPVRNCVDCANWSFT